MLIYHGTTFKNLTLNAMFCTEKNPVKESACLKEEDSIFFFESKPWDQNIVSSGKTRLELQPKVQR